MGWNSSVLLAHKKSLESLERAIPDVFVVTEKELDWETATSNSLYPNLALGILHDWAVLWTPNVRVATDPELLATLSRRTRAFTAILSSVDSYYGFCYYVNGKLKRRLIRQSFKVIEEEGAPLDEEQDLDWQDDEDTVVLLATKITGLDPTDSGTWANVKFKLATL